MKRLAILGVFGLGALAVASAARAEEPSKEGVEFFEKNIRPVLVAKCYSCHSAEAKKIKGEYRLDTRDLMVKGGESGKPALVPGEPDKSPFIVSIRRTDEDMAMPPKEKDALSPEQVKLFEEWVKMGAPDPRTAEKK